MGHIVIGCRCLSIGPWYLLAPAVSLTPSVTFCAPEDDTLPVWYGARYAQIVPMQSTGHQLVGHQLVRIKVLSIEANWHPHHPFITSRCMDLELSNGVPKGVVLPFTDSRIQPLSENIISICVFETRYGFIFQIH